MVAKSFNHTREPTQFQSEVQVDTPFYPQRTTPTPGTSDHFLIHCSPLKLAIHLSFLALFRRRFAMFVHYFVNYFVRLQTSYYTLLTISPISFIFDFATNLTRNLSYRPLGHFVKIPIAWRERGNTRWEKSLARRFTKCHLYTSHFSRFANIF